MQIPNNVAHLSDLELELLICNLLYRTDYYLNVRRNNGEKEYYLYNAETNESIESEHFGASLMYWVDTIENIL